MLQIANLRIIVGDTPILNGLTLAVPAGEVHTAMAPSGAEQVGLCYAGDRRPS